MFLKTLLSAAALVVLSSAPVLGQSLLEKVESKVKGVLGGAPPADAADAAAPAALPPTGYLGVKVNDAEEGSKGVRVIATTPKGPADIGGLKADDLITSIDGNPLTELADFDAVLDKAVVGQKLRFTVERGTKLQSFNITLGARAPLAPTTISDDPTAASPAAEPPATAIPAAEPPALEPPVTPTAPPRSPIRSKPLELGAPPAEAPEAFVPADPATPAPEPVAGLDPLDNPSSALPLESAPAEASGRPSLGITVVPLTEEARAQFGITVSRGALITVVKPGSAADRAGLPVGGVVVAIDGRRIDTADDLVATIRTGRVGQEIELSYYEGARLARKSVRLAPAAFGVVAAPPAGDELPRGLGIGGADRPLLNKVERMVEGFAGGARGPSTVYDPSEMAALRARVLELEQTVDGLQERIKLLETKLGNTPPAVNP